MYILYIQYIYCTYLNAYLNVYLNSFFSQLNVYSATIPDRMHHLDLGLFNYQVTYARELLKEYCGQIAVDELDNRLARIPRFPGLKIFKMALKILNGLLLMNFEI